MAGVDGQMETADGGDDGQKKLGTRVFKKSSPNSKITVYLGKRDFIDHLSHVDPIDGVVLIDPDYLKERKVYAHVLAAFRYGREDLDVLGLTFRKDLFLATKQVYPPPAPTAGEKDQPKQLTRLQERLLKKLGPNAYPFYFVLPSCSPASVTLQPAPGDTGKPCGVDYEMKTYVADGPDDKPHKRNSVQLAIRKLTYAPEEPAPQPSAEAVKDFMMSAGTLRLEATLDKEKYYHGESIAVNVLVDNNSGRSVKKVKISVRQHADICLFSTAQYKCTVAELESEEGFPIQANQTGFCKVFMLTPLLTNNRDKRGLALDGKLKHEDTNLASSTIMTDPSQKENLGIVVQYKVKVRLILGFGSRSRIPPLLVQALASPHLHPIFGAGEARKDTPQCDLSVELPFTLTHPKPVETPPPSRPTSTAPVGGGAPLTEGGDVPPADHNLIQLDTDANGFISSLHHDDDFIFEDFARLRLKGHDNDDTEA